jgi:hypothetical protein
MSEKTKLRYVLGVEGTLSTDLLTRAARYNVRMTVSQEVYEWLELHDVEYTDNRQKIFICNKVRYVDLGPLSLNLNNKQ